MTRMSALLVRFFYKAWFFGAFYFWTMWAFIAVSLLGVSILYLHIFCNTLKQISFISFAYVMIKPKQAVTEGLLDGDDLEDDI